MPDSTLTIIHPIRPIDAIRELNRLAATLKDAMLDPELGLDSYRPLRDELLRVSEQIRTATTIATKP
jgi:hypothetical protein